MTTRNSSRLAPMVRKLKQHSELSPTEADALLALPNRLATIKAGAFVVREGDKAPDDCILVLSGFAYRSKTAGSGARQILSVHLRGDLVDLQNSLLDIADHNVQALTSIEMAYIQWQDILKVTTACPNIGYALWRDTMIDASMSREWLLNIGRRNARQRVSHLLCELAMRQAATTICDGTNYVLPMTQSQIGDATGLTSVHVNRIFRSMREDGLVNADRRSLIITDWPRLQQAGDFSGAYLHQGAANSFASAGAHGVSPAG